MTQTDIRPKSVKILNRALEAICGLSTLAVVGGMLDRAYTHYVNLESSTFVPLATAAIVSGLLSIQCSKMYWDNHEESYDEFVNGWRKEHRK